MKANEYNYRHFDVKHYDWVNFPGPRAGTEAVDFSALTLNGDLVKLSDYFGKPIVLETGSLSCPMYVMGIAQRATLAQRHPDVQFLVLYVREAHPGGKIPAHSTIQDKLALARGIPVETFVRPLKEVDRAITDGEEEGFVKIHVKKGTSTVLGATIVARHAGEMINEVTLAMLANIGLGALASVIHPYPTQAEAIRQAGDAYNRTRLTPLVKRVFSRWLAWTR